MKAVQAMDKQMSTERKRTVKAWVLTDKDGKELSAVTSRLAARRIKYQVDKHCPELKPFRIVKLTGTVKVGGSK